MGVLRIVYGGGFASECTCLCLPLHLGVCVCVLSWVAEHTSTRNCIHLEAKCQELQDLKVPRDPGKLSIPPCTCVLCIGADQCVGGGVCGEDRSRLSKKDLCSGLGAPAHCLASGWVLMSKIRTSMMALEVRKETTFFYKQGS